MPTFIMKGRDRALGAIGALEWFREVVTTNTWLKANIDDALIAARTAKGREHIQIERCVEKPRLLDTAKVRPPFQGLTYGFGGFGGEFLREFGRWYNFGSNVSWARLSPNSYRMRDDDTGEVFVPAGPAARDACMMTLFYGDEAKGGGRAYAIHNLGSYAYRETGQ